jgi:two-component system cell cycle response regulator DivK
MVMSKKILIVEDAPLSMKVLRTLLRSYGYSLLEATDGEEALKVTCSDKPDLIIMDIQLPKVSGLEVTRQLRQMSDFNHTPIIALTAYAINGDKEKIISVGCDAYVAKPINTRELPRLITEMLLQRKESSA